MSATDSTSARPPVMAVVPAYNAAASVGDVVRQLSPHVERIIVVNDGSSDDTAAVARAAGAHVVDHAENCGLGCALRTGFAEALTLGADIIVTLDADGQHSPGDINKLVVRLVANHCEMVVGSRLIDKSQHEKFPPLRLFGNHLLTWMTNVAAGAKVTTDSQSGYRAFNREVLEAIELHTTHMAISSEIILEVHAAGFRIAEIPIEATYEDEVSYQRFFQDPPSIMAMLAGRIVRRFFGGGRAGQPATVPSAEPVRISERDA